MASSEEVAEDYKASLEFLTSNDRYAINNFTVIAKENTEHADAISTVLVEHIAKAPPNHKLPALYVLDSIAKNIGTPYTLFLGHRLYNTFMGAYSLVDHGVRKKLDEMLKTWKQPVPGSMESRPVFDSSITKRIENALIQVKTRTLQHEQQQQRAQQDLLRRKTPVGNPSTQWRSTPTPPQADSRYHPPMPQGYTQYQAAQYQNTNEAIQARTNSPYTQYQHLQQPQLPILPHQPAYNAQNNQNQYQHPASIESLHRDLNELIQKTKEDFARNPYDGGTQTRLKALLDLQTVLRTQQLPPDQLQAVRSQVNLLQATRGQQLGTSTPTPVLPHSSTPVLPIVPINHTPAAQVPYQPPSAPNPAPELPSSNFLASLLASAARNKTQTPQEAQTLPSQSYPSQPPNQPNPTSANAENPLIAQLRASGLLSSLGTPASNNLNTSQGPQIAQNSNGMAALNLSALLRPPLAERRNEVELTSASLKQSRPHLISKLYEAQPNQCLTCGKRFLSTETGRSRKAKHMDWHFRTNQRLADAAQRGQSRSWYVGELDWIQFRDNEEGIDTSAANGSHAGISAAEAAKQNDPKNKFIPVPSDSALASMPCPICQEKFETSWNEDLQDFVWMDAMRVGGKIYHASCYADYKKDEESTTPARNSTPDSVLGKRKAEAASNNPSPAKIKKENED